MLGVGPSGSGTVGCGASCAFPTLHDKNTTITQSRNKHRQRYVLLFGSMTQGNTQVYRVRSPELRGTSRGAPNRRSWLGGQDLFYIVHSLGRTAAVPNRIAASANSSERRPHNESQWSPRGRGQVTSADIFGVHRAGTSAGSTRSIRGVGRRHHPGR
jgi:hypothetical protein